ncbi:MULTISPECIES: diacylglycerol kinase [unclassified Streptomyces]|uniref:diacylglycerol kinase n=1 Tax=unclassified Streptomyces TaxID=2593676 RepID=UPI00214B112F|nr:MULTISPECIES: diacylglycerol kinase [unclassified Streptomyces]MCX5607097.1 diacylglycerol kinase [Streptomyces sp. NBC_00047]UUU44645.1 diacylglycerol kinase [Streptomyces sp. NBC_00162]
MSHAGAPVGGLLVLVDPVARRLDGESVRIAKDVLSAGAAAKICLPDSQEEFARALARRGQRRLVIVGDDRALVRAVGLLHRERGLAEGPLSLVPVGPAGSLGLAGALGVPLSAVAAARAVLEGSVRMCDLLVDDSDGVVLQSLRIPPLRAAAAARPPAGPSVWSAYRSLVRTLVRPVAGPGVDAARLRLRVEADGVVLADVDRPVEEVSVTTGEDGGLAEVVVRTGGGGAGSEVSARAKTVSVSGTDFRYRADAAMTGPVRRRTWTLHPSAWALTVPR